MATPAPTRARPGRRRARLGRLAAVSVAAGAALVLAPSAGGQVALTTPYPSVAVEPGERVTFDLIVTSRARERVALDVRRAPTGWQAVLRGGGFVIDGVTAGGPEPPEVTLEVRAPRAARRGRYTIVVAAVSDSGTSTLPIQLRVTRAAGGSAQLNAEFTRLRGPSDATFPFNLDLENATPRETTFNLAAAGPEGWQVNARPTGQEQASSVTVDAGNSASIEVEADPPDDVEGGTYPILVRAVGGGVEARAELEVEITGTFALTLTTPSERLNADVRAGDTESVPLLVVNDGTAPLAGVELSATPPTDWQVDFEPETVERVAPGESARVAARIRPADDAVAGDYVVTLTASVPEASAEVDLRTTVKTSRVWGFLGLALIALAIAGLAWVFRRYGRR